MRPTNQSRAWKRYRKLMEEYKAVDDALQAAVDTGAAKSGCLIAYSSAFNYGMTKLLTAPARTKNMDIHVWEKMAREGMERAKEFVETLP